MLIFLTAFFLSQYFGQLERNAPYSIFIMDVRPNPHHAHFVEVTLNLHIFFLMQVNQNQALTKKTWKHDRDYMNIHGLFYSRASEVVFSILSENTSLHDLLLYYIYVQHAAVLAMLMCSQVNPFLLICFFVIPCTKDYQSESRSTLQVSEEQICLFCLKRKQPQKEIGHIVHYTCFF